MAKTKPGASPGPMPDRGALQEAALTHLARYTATEAGLVRVLDRRIARWARAASAPEEDVIASRRTAREVARALAGAGAIDDAAFAAARARRLVRAGRSRRAVAAHLASKGVGAELAQAAMPDPEAELLAAIAYARRRRMGPFGPPEAGTVSDADRRGPLAAMARAGFPRTVAEQALQMSRDDAEQRLLALKQG